MPSFISNSDTATVALPRPRSQRISAASWALIGLALVYCAGVEVMARYAVPRISRIEHRTKTEYASVLGMGGETAGARSVLVLGNSLLKTGVLFDEVHQALLPDADARRLIIESTDFYDWYYGIQSLFSAGARPDVVAVTLTPRQLVATSIRGDYSAYWLFSLGGVIEYAQTAKLSNTQTSSLLFAKLSAFFGLREEIRKVLAEKLFPDLPALMALLTKGKSRPLSDDLLYQLAQERLRELDQLARSLGTQAVFVIPPVPGNGAQSEVVLRAAQAVGARALYPLHADELTTDAYSDGFHLNEQGAEVFTAHFIESLRRELARDRESARRSGRRAD